MLDITNREEHLYELVANDLREKIKENFFGEDNKIPNYLELTGMYKVSMSTIRRAMKILNEEEVLVSRVGKGTFTSRKFLASNGTRPTTVTDKIGLMIRDIEGPYFSAVYKALADMADQERKKLMLTVSRDFYQQEDSLLRLMLAQEMDGILLTTRRKSIYGTKIYDLLQEKKVPSVILHDVYDSKLAIVDVDNYRGGELAAERLLSLKRKRFCVIVGEIGYRADDQRLEGFTQRLRDAGVSMEQDCHIFRYSFGMESTAFDEGYKLGMSLAVRELGIDAIFLFNDLIAMGFQKAMIERGFGIPEDIAVIGFDNIERCSEARVPLTTIEVPRYEIGARAFTILQALINGELEEMSIRTLLEPKLIVRHSA